MAKLFVSVAFLLWSFDGRRLGRATLGLLSHLGGYSSMPDTVRHLFLGQFEIVLQSQRKLRENIGQRSAVGLVVTQNIHFAIERSRSFAAQLVNLVRHCFRMLEQFCAQLALAVGHLLFQLAELLLN